MQTTFCGRGGGNTSTNGGFGVEQRTGIECTRAVFWRDARNTQSVIEASSWRSPFPWCYEVSGLDQQVQGQRKNGIYAQDDS